MSGNRTLFGRLAGACLAAAFCVDAARGAVYDASTGYVTLTSNTGSTANDSPMSMTKATDSSSTEANPKYFWSDHLPMHAGTNYYAHVGFRTILETGTGVANHHVFPGGKIVFGPRVSLAWKTFAPSSYEFANEGALVYGGAAFVVNQNVARPVIVRGRIEVVESASNNPFKFHPWGAQAGYSEGLGFNMEAAIVADANQYIWVRSNTNATYPGRGYVQLMGDMSQFLGTIEVSSNRLFVCNETLANAKLVKVNTCGELFTGAADGGTGAGIWIWPPVPNMGSF